ncbi:hypothetical protein ACO0F1_18785 [Acinetobacter baumannii]|uniref:hypothetical protein n=1 Tax=Acinetobacter baumannii TaxID=470 RepID=UPI001F54C3EF|nr:hypothetical protein [Acinetobacter baumannii]MCP8510494.1 hypothetical protein [Acinetobacter baumannii]MCP8537294.1 hypothetical protein [Acinetobacter baumannii]MCP8552937.1 hypothetical protein [Acinetobacter baumannii]MCP9105917.1 hypothetical protein [Acinetobacter baumannii]MCP9117082.1 hypothetical protein [Acinetobacter baumannii]
MKINSNLICKKVESPRSPLYEVWDVKQKKQVTDGNLSANTAWLTALRYLLEGPNHE